MTAPLDLILVRHGESEGNVANRASRRGDDSWFTDSFLARHSATWALTERGRDQARFTGRWLLEHGPSFGRFYVSPYVRALQTAGLLGLPEARWFIEPNLRERDWGRLDTMTQAERSQRFADVLAARDRDPFLWTPPDGESIAAVDARLHPVRDTLHRECSQMAVLMVCHGEVMWSMRSRLERLTSEQWRRLDGSDDPKDKIANGQVLWYSRRHPETAEVSGSIAFVRSLNPADPTTDTGFVPITRRSFSNQELLDYAAREGSVSSLA